MSKSLSRKTTKDITTISFSATTMEPPINKLHDDQPAWNMRRHGNKGWHSMYRKDRNKGVVFSAFRINLSLQNQNDFIVANTIAVIYPEFQAVISRSISHLSSKSPEPLRAVVARL